MAGTQQKCRIKEQVSKWQLWFSGQVQGYVGHEGATSHSRGKDWLGTSPPNMTLSAYFWPQTHPTLSKDLDTEGSTHKPQDFRVRRGHVFEEWPNSPLLGPAWSTKGPPRVLRTGSRKGQHCLFVCCHRKHVTQPASPETEGSCRLSVGKRGVITWRQGF